MSWISKGDITDKKDKIKTGQQCSSKFMVVLGLATLVTAGFLFSSLFLREKAVDHGEETHSLVDFKKKFNEVCASPLLPIPVYRGVESFFLYLTNPDTSHCYSWLEFGGEKIMIPTQMLLAQAKQYHNLHSSADASVIREEKQCMDEIRKTKMICFNEEYHMNKDPCLVYSFTKDADQQFERDMHMFSCYVHVFDANQITEAEHVKRTEYWMEHAWDIAEYPYDKPETSASGTLPVDGRTIRRRSLDYIAHVLRHEKKIVNFIKSDHEGREWILLKQIIMNKHLIDVHQIGVRIHLPTSVNAMSGTARHEYFRDLFQIFQGLACIGYKYVLGRPAKYYRGVIKVPEMDKKYFIAYELNFAKVLNTTASVSD